MRDPDIAASIRRIALQAQLGQVSANYARAADAMDALEKITARLLELNEDIADKLHRTRRALALSIALSSAALALAGWSLASSPGLPAGGRADPAPVPEMQGGPADPHPGLSFPPAAEPPEDSAP